MKEIFDYINARYLGEKGQGMVEYALILAFVVGIAVVLSSNDGIKGGLEAAFNKVTTCLKTNS